MAGRPRAVAGEERGAEERGAEDTTETREEPGLGAAGLAGRLAQARAGALVGRDSERAVLDRMLSGAADAPLVAYMYGPGGIGKSSLVRYAAQQAELTGRRVVHVDGRFLDADPRRLEELAAPACAA